MSTFCFVWLLNGAAASMLPPTDPEFIPPYRDERFVEFDDHGVTRRLAMMLNAKVLNTSFSPTLPLLDDATTIYDAILNEDDLVSARDTVLGLTRGILTDWQPRFLDIDEKIDLPLPQFFAIEPPVNQTSACSLLELFELYLNFLTLDTPFQFLLDGTAFAYEIGLIDAFVRENQGDDLFFCLKSRVGTFNGTRFTAPTYVYGTNYPGILEGPYASQFWHLPYLLKQGPRAVSPTQRVEGQLDSAGEFLSYVLAQTAPVFRRLTTNQEDVAGEYRWLATAVHSDALMADGVQMLDIFLNSNLTRWDCGRFIDENDVVQVPQADFVTCTGCIAFYDLYYGSARYSLLGAFTAKKKFNRIRPEAFAHRLSLLAGPYSPLANGHACLTASLDDCLAFGIPAEVCDLVAAGEPFNKYEVRNQFPELVPLVLMGAGFDFLEFYAGQNDDCVLLQTMYSEGGPRHDSYPGGHSVFAGSTITSLSAMFCMYESDEICQGILGDESEQPALKLWDDFQVYGEGTLTGVDDDALEFLFRDVQSEVFFDNERASSTCAGTRIVIDFEHLNEGQVSKVSVGAGITVLSPEGSEFDATIGIVADSNTINQDVNAATIFDGTCAPKHNPSGCTGHDRDLFFPQHGNIVIINEDKNFWNPDDSLYGGTIVFDFGDVPGRVDVEQVTILDVEDWFSASFLFEGSLPIPLTITGNNKAKVQHLNKEGVTSMALVTGGPGAIDDITLCVTPQANIVRAVWEADTHVPNRLVETNLDTSNVTVWYEMVKWAQQYTHARDRAGVHYWSDGCAGMFLGEIMTIRYIIADLSIRPQADLGEKIVKPLMDGRNVVITAEGVRLFGSSDPPTMDVNFLVTDNPPIQCGNFIAAVPMNEEVPIL